jgi:endonuclease/exonuclease/phosphatase family metal-dependent hydrolase
MTRLSVLLVCLVLAACDSGPTPDPAAEHPRVSVMAFNVENLFDTEDDPGKDDATYLPASVKSAPEHVAGCALIEVDRWREDCLYLDWSEDALRFKLEQLAATILAYNDGIGPDIIALQEVENLGVLDRLRREHLQPAGYLEPILIEGIDDRGIDVAFLTRLPLVGEPVLHPLDMSAFPDGAQDTRGILEANFRLPDGTVLTGFSVHFPAPFHPIEMREIAYDHLNRVRAGIPEDRPVFAAGDFNTPKREKEGTTIMDDRVRPYWTVAHEVGCADCKGTNYWVGGQIWSFLDMILFSSSAAGRWTLDVDAIEVVTGYADQLRDDGTPKRFNLQAREGVSDHLPIVMVLERRP